MSLEPKKPIDELLEATARARRAQFGADPKMPNPMRAQLQHEIARLGRTHEQRSAPFFRIPRLRLAFATAFALILVSASGLWWWHEHQTGGRETLKLAMQEPAKEAPPPEKVFEQGAAAAGPAAPTFADSNAVASRPAEEAKDADALTKSAGTATALSTTGAMTEGLMGAGTKADQSLLANKSLAAKETPATPASASPAQNRQLTSFRQQSSQNAAKQAFRGKLKQTLNILNEFQVEQTDHEIRVVDADGSTYSGKLEPLTQNDARSIFNQKRNYAAPSSRAATSIDDKAQAANVEFHFRATGYNSSLKKHLVFEGNYIASSVSAQKKVAKAEAEEREEQIPPRITGIAKIPGESPVQIDAIAVAK
jgi:hypothetical protein